MIPPTVSAESGGGAQVWQWRDGCDRPAIVQVVIDAGKTRLLDTRMPLCKGARQPAAESKSPIEFPVHDKAIRFDTAQDAPLTGSVWVAGEEPDGVTLGISFHTDERVLLNTLRFVSSSIPSRAEIMDGVTLSTVVERSKTL
jgi:hypothetical protein